MSEIKPISELDAGLRKIVRRAIRARRHAYAPYSGFAVGVAILDENGKIHTGCNVETAAYKVLHAEEVAIGKLISRGAKKLSVLVVAASEDVPALPCGHCCQLISEFGTETRIVAVNARGTVFRELAFREIFPYGFSSEQLKS